MFIHAVTAQLAHGQTAGAALGGRDEAVVVGIEPGKALFGPGLDISDHDRTPDHDVMTASPAALTLHPTRAAVGTNGAHGLTGGVKLAPADIAVVIGVKTTKAGVGTTGPVGLYCGAAFIGRDRTIPIGISGRQTLNTLTDELGLAEAAIAISVGAHRPGRSLLGKGGTGRGQHEGGQATDEKGLVHHIVLHGRPSRPQSLSED